MESLKTFVRSQAPEFLKRANVTSVGIGYKEKDGKPTKQLSIQFTVGRKMAPEVLETLAEPALPKSFNVDGVDVPTDILERSYDKALKAVAAEDAPARKRAIDPIVPGVSVGHPDISAGEVVGGGGSHIGAHALPVHVVDLELAVPVLASGRDTRER